MSFGGGEKLIFTSGEYSDFQIKAGVEVLGPFNLVEEVEEFKALELAKPEEERADWTSTTYHAFVNHLIDKALVELLDYEEVHLGSHGELEV